VALRFVYFLASARMSNYAPSPRVLFEIVVWYDVELNRVPPVRALRSEASRRNVMGRLDRLAKASLLEDGAERFGFALEIKTCHACAILAHANVGYDFDRNSKFAGTHLLTILAAPPE
jgi:hypothetical protein